MATDSRLATTPAVERRIQAAAVLVASYTSRTTAQAVVSDKNASIRAATEARESLARRKKELDYALEILSAHHTVQL